MFFKTLQDKLFVPRLWNCGNSVQDICEAQVKLRYQLLGKLITNFRDVFDWEHGQILVVTFSQEITWVRES